jgi:hypothetical protein
MSGLCARVLQHLQFSHRRESHVFNSASKTSQFEINPAKSLTGNEFLSLRRIDCGEPAEGTDHFQTLFMWQFCALKDNCEISSAVSAVLQISSAISSAVSAVLRGKNFSRVEAADAEQCGYGDLR